LNIEIIHKTKLPVSPTQVTIFYSQLADLSIFLHENAESPAFTRLWKNHAAVTYFF